MKNIISILFITIFFLSSPVHAGGIFFFGEQDNIHQIMDIEVVGAENEDLFLGYKTHSYFFLAGVYIEDAGYVLGVKGNDSLYYPFPTGEELEQSQAAGYLPNPLPKYEIPLMDWLIGYSLWIILIVLIIWTVLFGNKTEEKAND